jgi:uncharacterized protein involved in exopolysaccharide biosynthesis
MMKNNLLISALYLALQNKKFIIINVSVVTIAALVIALLLPKWYFSSATLKLSSQGTLNPNSLIGSLTDIPFLGDLGLGETQANIDRYIAILESRTVLDSMVYKFDLQTRYKQKYRFLTRQQFLNNSVREGDPRTEILTVGVFDKDPESAKAMVDYYVSLLDNAVQKLFNENARNNRIFIEKRLQENKEDLQVAENRLASFQQKQGIFQPDEQVLLSLKVAADLEADLMAEEIKLGLAQKMYSKGSQEIKDLQLRIDEIQKKINEMKRSSGNHITNESFLMRFDKAPELALEYLRLFREVEIKSKLLEYLIPIYEKAKIDEMKDTPSLLVIDEPQVPEYKSKPKRAYIVIGGFLFSLMFSLAVVLFRNYYQNFYENADESLKSKLRYIKSHIPAWRQHKM